MAYKHLKSVAHNFGHSFLSLMNYLNDDYIIEHIYKIAKRNDQSFLQIDFLKKEIKPECFDINAINVSVINYSNWLPELLESEGCSIKMVKSLKMEIIFDFKKDRKSKIGGLIYQSYNAKVILIDDRGNEHVAKIPEWWKY